MGRRDLTLGEALLPRSSNNTSRDGVTPTVQVEKPAQIPWSSLPNKTQLFLLALCRLSEPLSNTCLLPYIYYLMRSVLEPGADQTAHDAARQISRYSGILVASFPLAQFATSMLWARIADKHGRRSTIVGALLISLLANIAFGFSQSFGALMFWRTLAGIANGNIGVMRTMTAEIVVERKYQTKAFLLLPLIFNSGMVAGMALGGCLADPVSNLPWFFGPRGIFNLDGSSKGVQWVVEYPYALPALLNASMLSIAFLLSFFWLRETLDDKVDDRDFGVRFGQKITRSFKKFLAGKKGYSSLTSIEVMESDEEISVVKIHARPGPPPSGAPIKTPFTRDVRIALVTFALLPLHNSAFMHIFPVYLSSPSSANTKSSYTSFSGGLALSSPTIGLWLGLLGTCGIILQLHIYPRLQSRIGTLGNLRIALFLFPLTYLLAPYLSFLGTSQSLARFIPIVGIAWSQGMARTFAIPSTVILLTDSAPDKRVLGLIHGAGNMVASLARAVGPALGGVVYGYGVENDMVGAVWWFYLLVIALIALAWSFKMKHI